MRLDELKISDKKKQIANHFVNWCKKRLGIEKPVKLFLTNNFDKVKNNRTFGSTFSDGTVWVYVGNRNTADILRTICHELVHCKQFEDGKAHDDMDDDLKLDVEDEANALAGRMMRDYGKEHVEIYEGKTGTLQADVAAALPATYVIPQLKNQDPYLQYRFSVAMAGAKGRKNREADGVAQFAKESPWGENEIVIGYDPHLEEYIDDALAQMGLSGKRLISTPKSEETDDVGKKSPINGFKGY